MKRCCFYFLGFLVAVMTATASRLSYFDMDLDAQTEVALETRSVAQDSCALPELALVESSGIYPLNKQEP
jgi:hypothetical protein